MHWFIHKQNQPEKQKVIAQMYFQVVLLPAFLNTVFVGQEWQRGAITFPELQPTSEIHSIVYGIGNARTRSWIFAALPEGLCQCHGRFILESAFQERGIFNPEEK